MAGKREGQDGSDRLPDPHAQDAEEERRGALGKIQDQLSTLKGANQGGENSTRPQTQAGPLEQPARESGTPSAGTTSAKETVEKPRPNPVATGGNMQQFLADLDKGRGTGGVSQDDKSNAGASPAGASGSPTADARRPDAGAPAPLPVPQAPERSATEGWQSVQSHPHPGYVPPEGARAGTSEKGDGVERPARGPADQQPRDDRAERSVEAIIQNEAREMAGSRAAGADPGLKGDVEKPSAHDQVAAPPEARPASAQKGDEAVSRPASEAAVLPPPATGLRTADSVPGQEQRFPEAPKSGAADSRQTEPAVPRADSTGQHPPGPVDQKPGAPANAQAERLADAGKNAMSAGGLGAAGGVPGRSAVAAEGASVDGRSAQDRAAPGKGGEPVQATTREAREITSRGGAEGTTSPGDPRLTQKPLGVSGEPGTRTASSQGEGTRPAGAGAGRLAQDGGSSAQAGAARDLDVKGMRPGQEAGRPEITDKVGRPPAEPSRTDMPITKVGEPPTKAGSADRPEQGAGRDPKGMGISGGKPVDVPPVIVPPGLPGVQLDGKGWPWRVPDKDPAAGGRGTAADGSGRPGDKAGTGQVPGKDQGGAGGRGGTGDIAGGPGRDSKGMGIAGGKPVDIPPVILPPGVPDLPLGGKGLPWRVPDKDSTGGRGTAPDGSGRPGDKAGTGQIPGKDQGGAGGRGGPGDITGGIGPRAGQGRVPAQSENVAPGGKGGKEGSDSGKSPSGSEGRGGKRGEVPIIMPPGLPAMDGIKGMLSGRPGRPAGETSSAGAVDAGSKATSGPGGKAAGDVGSRGDRGGIADAPGNRPPEKAPFIPVAIPPQYGMLDAAGKRASEASSRLARNESAPSTPTERQIPGRAESPSRQVRESTSARRADLPATAGDALSRAAGPSQGALLRDGAGTRDTIRPKDGSAVPDRSAPERKAYELPSLSIIGERSKTQPDLLKKEGQEAGRRPAQDGLRAGGAPSFSDLAKREFATPRNATGQSEMPKAPKTFRLVAAPAPATEAPRPAFTGTPTDPEMAEETKGSEHMFAEHEQHLCYQAGAEAVSPADADSDIEMAEPAELEAAALADIIDSEIAGERDESAQLVTENVHVVKPGDTLESIADRRYCDSILALLLLEKNKGRIETIVVHGERVLDLRPGTVLYLPTNIEIREFRNRLASGLTSIFKYAGQHDSPEEELAAWEEARNERSDNA